MANEGQGYFTGTSPDIGLGDYAFASAGLAQERITLDPSLPLAKVVTVHGGILAVNVVAYCERANLGDAEWWITTRLAALASSDAGILAVQDNHGRAVTYPDALFVSARANVEALTVGVIDMEFLAPLTSASPTWGETGTETETESWSGVPDEPDEYADRATSQDYACNGVEFGVGPMAQFAVDRAAQLRVIPRCKGARVSPAPQAAAMTIEIVADQVSDSDHWQVQTEDAFRTIGVAKRDLTGNGNTWDNCVLDAIDPSQTDDYWTTVTYRFLRELS